VNGQKYTASVQNTINISTSTVSLITDTMAFLLPLWLAKYQQLPMFQCRKEMHFSTGTIVAWNLAHCWRKVAHQQSMLITETLEAQNGLLCIFPAWQWPST